MDLFKLLLGLDAAVRAVCPIHGVSVQDPAKRETWSIDYREDATKDERAAARAVLLAFEPLAPTSNDVNAEKDRRLALGFDFEFPDERGLHHIGTTDVDMKGWNEVTTWATLQTLRSNTSDTIEISTDTGLVRISPPEWLSILAAATAFRQPIWKASFDLVAAPSIPADFAEDAYWQ